MHDRLRIGLLLFWTTASFAVPAVGQEAQPAPVLADTVPYTAVPQIPGLATKWLVGTGADSSLYMMRVQLAPATRLPLHTHPDTRFTQVLSGTLYVGFGAAVDTAGVTAIPAGGVFVTPAGTPHFVWARDERVVYQETGMGPTGNHFVEGSGP